MNLDILLKISKTSVCYSILLKLSSGFCPILRNNQKSQANFEWFDGSIEFPGNGHHEISEKAREHGSIESFVGENRGRI
jgi:hypothetical protein